MLSSKEEHYLIIETSLIWNSGAEVLFIQESFSSVISTFPLYRGLHIRIIQLFRVELHQSLHNVTLIQSDTLHHMKIGTSAEILGSVRYTVYHYYGCRRQTNYMIQAIMLQLYMLQLVQRLHSLQWYTVYRTLPKISALVLISMDYMI